MKFEKGDPGGPGRGKGSKNKFTNIKEQFLAAYEGIGGLDALTIWAKKEKNKTEFYKMLTKLFPREIIGELKIGKSVSEYSTEELVELITEDGKIDTLH